MKEQLRRTINRKKWQLVAKSKKKICKHLNSLLSRPGSRDFAISCQFLANRFYNVAWRRPNYHEVELRNSRATSNVYISSWWPRPANLSGSHIYPFVFQANQGFEIASLNFQKTVQTYLEIFSELRGVSKENISWKSNYKCFQDILHKFPWDLQRIIDKKSVDLLKNNCGNAWQKYSRKAFSKPLQDLMWVELAFQYRFCCPTLLSTDWELLINRESRLLCNMLCSNIPFE